MLKIRQVTLFRKAGDIVQQLPIVPSMASTGPFPGPMINAEYGKPALVRFENDLDKKSLRACSSGLRAPDWAFLTHLHNGHQAPESDGQPHYMQMNDGGYTPGDWCDNLYLMYPAGAIRPRCSLSSGSTTTACTSPGRTSTKAWWVSCHTMTRESREIRRTRGYQWQCPGHGWTRKRERPCA